MLDIIFRDDRLIAAQPGGSMLNTAVSLGRAGTEVYLISDLATDQAGGIILDFLKHNGVSTKYTGRYRDGKTALALAFLNDRQDASYSFYKEYPHDRLNIVMPEAGPGDIVLFGSYFALDAAVSGKLDRFTRRSRENGAFLIYDPNFRRPHLGELERLRPRILDNIGIANLVRGSDEDFRHIFSVSNAHDAFSRVREAGCPALVYTRNSRDVEVMTGEYSRAYPVPQVKLLSTIGAGDAFNAGIIYAATNLTGLQTLKGPVLDDLIHWGIRFSADVCQSLDNHISVDFGNLLKQQLA